MKGLYDKCTRVFWRVMRVFDSSNRGIVGLDDSLTSNRDTSLRKGANAPHVMKRLYDKCTRVFCRVMRVFDSSNRGIVANKRSINH